MKRLVKGEKSMNAAKKQTGLKIVRRSNAPRNGLKSLR